ncbi:relaxase/mobilization nuclease-like protein [Dysgonomonas alginatilytica]|uniref:Relaxase/mobilization nuclease-like protein n=1 Tax=Dysgonomonas alginatilytica TaxID=1605892 RepID=A0A2V3PMB5_9BACT|nr:conjugal transfer protein MobB [Dysgonomonas alginatilytica]PXV61094.1 relaxase/mobilization nuclease-like protein [Dysgonomonas alginatilytica]
MVAKINKGSSLHGALSYNQEKVKEGQAKVLFSNRIMLNRDGSLNMYLANQSFEPYLNANKNTEKPVLHISINPHPNDEVSDDVYSDIAQTYMQKMGYGDQPYIVYKHEDLDRQHIHIVTVNIDETGKKINDSNDYYQSKKITRELEQTYNLHTAEKKTQSEELHKLKRVDYQSGDIKKQIGNTAKALIKGYRFQSVNEYRALFSLYGVTVEEIKGEAKGKAYNGLVYSAINDNGEKIGNPIKASVIGKSVGYDALQRRLEYSTKYMKENKVFDSPKLIVRSAFDNYTDKQNFLSDLAKNGMSVIFRGNAEGRIYGAIFIDHQNRTVFNGSKMGKEFSANIFNDLFKNDSQEQQQATTRHSDTSDKETFTDIQKDSFVESAEHENNNNSTLIPSLLEQHGTDYEAEAFARQKEAEYKRRKRSW